MVYLVHVIANRRVRGSRHVQQCMTIAMAGSTMWTQCSLPSWKYRVAPKKQSPGGSPFTKDTANQGPKNRYRL